MFESLLFVGGQVFIVFSSLYSFEKLRQICGLTFEIFEIYISIVEKFAL